MAAVAVKNHAIDYGSEAPTSMELRTIFKDFELFWRNSLSGQHPLATAAFWRNYYSSSCNDSLYLPNHGTRD